MKLDELKFREIQVLYLKRQIIENQYNLVDSQVKNKLTEMGLDSSKNYMINENQFTIEEVNAG